MDENTYRIVKVVLAALFLVVLFLFALNGRYDKLGSHPAAIDKWTSKIVVYKN